MKEAGRSGQSQQMGQFVKLVFHANCLYQLFGKCGVWFEADLKLLSWVVL